MLSCPSTSASCSVYTANAVTRPHLRKNLKKINNKQIKIKQGANGQQGGKGGRFRYRGARWAGGASGPPCDLPAVPGSRPADDKALSVSWSFLPGLTWLTWLTCPGLQDFSAVVDSTRHRAECNWQEGISRVSINPLSWSREEGKRGRKKERKGRVMSRG